MVQSHNKKVFVGMSGGVDSSVAALLLKREGYDVVGVFMKNWSENLAGGECLWAREQEDARKTTAKIGIPIYTFDFEEEYKKRVFDYMIKEYTEGRTPNPDVMCNKEIKFGLFLEKALAMGADYVATGHYVRIENQESGIKMFAAKDKNKDQSYFLWTLGQEQLKHCLFPAGDYLKSEVREIARKFALPTADKKDSQGVCFIGKFDFAEFLKSRISGRRGLIKTVDGKIIGEHDSLSFYTIGQRKGIGIGGIGPFYVADKNEKENVLIVAPDNENAALFHSEIIINNIHWISGNKPSLPLKCEARIRYRQPLQKAVIYEDGKMVFDQPQRAVSPGQSVVFYRGEEMLGGGVIKNAAK